MGFLREWRRRRQVPEGSAEMNLEEYQAFREETRLEWDTAEAVLYRVDESLDPLTGTLERQRHALLFKTEGRNITIFRDFLTALDYGDEPGELRFTIARLPWKSITFKPAREEGWIYWAAGR